jgi:hypothetical protein
MPAIKEIKGDRVMPTKVDKAINIRRTPEWMIRLSNIRANSGKQDQETATATRFDREKQTIDNPIVNI